MKAAIIRKYGGVKVVGIEETADPIPQKNQVVIQIRSAALNHLDIWVRNGRSGQKLPMPHILGSDAAGIIIEKGIGAHGINVGDEVILNPGLSCGCCEFCRKGEQSECVSFGITGMTAPGTFAEKVAVPFYNLWPKPKHLNFDEAASIGLVYQTAWRMLITKAKLRAGQTVLIHGIGGGVASASLQLAKLAGAEVIATSSSAEKLAKAESMGASHIVNYKTTSDMIQAVRDITHGRGVDIVVDTVGVATWDADLSVVRRGGLIVLCGVTTGATARTNLQRLYWDQLTIIGSTMGSNEDLRQVLNVITTTQLKPVIDSVEPLDNIKRAMSKMEKGNQFGKIVLKIS